MTRLWKVTLRNSHSRVQRLERHGTTETFSVKFETAKYSRHVQSSKDQKPYSFAAGVLQGFCNFVHSFVRAFTG
jgi:hypothetical protein